MRKILWLIAVIAIAALVFTGCSGKKEASGGSATSSSSQSGSSGGGTSISDLSVDNWQAVIKDNFGIDYTTLPSGWTFDRVNSPNGRSNIKLFLKIGGDVTGEAEGKRLFELTKSLSPNGNYNHNVDWKAETVSAGDTLNDINEAGLPISGFTWGYNYNSKGLMINYYAIEGYQAEYTFTVR